MLLIIVLTVLFIINCKSQTDTLPNIGFLGTGYDLIKGNPNPIESTSPEDPGWKLETVEFTYNDGLKTDDLRYSIPDHTEAVSITACSFDSTATRFSGTQSYSDHLSESASVEGSVSYFADVSFSASGSYQSIQTSTYTDNDIYESAVGFCSAYKASLEPLSYELKSGFIASVENLPLTIDITNNDDPYFIFIGEYGTNYATTIEMGSKYSRTYKFSSSSYASMKYQKWDISATAKVSYEIATGAASTSTDDEKEQAQEFDSMTSNIYETILGSNPPTDGDISTWETDSFGNPYPYNYVLASISDLLTSVFFPNDDDIQTKQNNLINALQQYCGIVSGCGEHTDDVTPQYIQVERSSVAGGYGKSTCPEGSIALSCGYQGIDVDGYAEQFWGVYPQYPIWSGYHDDDPNFYTCIAYDEHRANLYAVCISSDLVKEFDFTVQYVAYQPIQSSGHVDVSCPDDYRVTGCGAWAYNGGNYEEFKQIYPNSDGTSCHCKNYEGGGCYASCSNAVDNSRIYQTEGSGTLTVKCEGEPIVFGCGILLSQQGYEKWPAFYVSDYNQCTGYSYYTFTLYAICGSFKDTALDEYELTHPEIPKRFVIFHIYIIGTIGLTLIANLLSILILYSCGCICVRSKYKRVQAIDIDHDGGDGNVDESNQ